MGVLNEAVRERVDGELQAWRQGDCVLGEHWFIFRTDLIHPLTEDGAVAASEATDNVETEVPGFMVVTQTCDIVRSCGERPFIEVSPLVEVDDIVLREIERGRRPNYAAVAGLSQDRLVADLDRVMTVEKSVVSKWARVAGCHNDDDARQLMLALVRKRARVAFPDDFVRFAAPLMRRMSSKHDKGSDEGRALRALREIRVRAAPSWLADEVALMFWFIRNEDEPTFENQGWEHFLNAWQKRVPPSGRFAQVDGAVQTLEDLTARDYVESSPLDLDYLTIRARS